uniref:Hydantoinase_A domain-containing protein n=1 Tax=Panagrellus redivivus TaxID=6233 RepID=A0A7E4UX76_PANRE
MNGVDSPLPKADKLSIDVFGYQGDDELAVEPVPGPSMLASRRSLPIDESGRGMADAEMKTVQRSKTDASKVRNNPSQPPLKTPGTHLIQFGTTSTPTCPLSARRSRSRTPLTEVFTKACHRLTSNDLMAIPSQKTVFVSTPVHTNRKSLRIDLSPIGKHVSSPAASTRRTISAISNPPARGPSILPPTDPTNATSSTSAVSVLPPTDETESSPGRITFDDVHTASIPPKKSILKSTQRAESTVKSNATTIQSLNFGDDESADMFDDSGPGFGDAVVSVVSDLNTESVHVSEVVADVSDEHMDSESRISKVDASEAVSANGDGSKSVFVTPVQSMDASTSQMASPASVVASAPVGEAVDSAAERTLEDVDGSIVEWHATLDSSTVEDDKALSTLNRLSEVPASRKSTDSVSRLHTPFVSVRKSHRPSVQCDVDKENSVASGFRTIDKENSIFAETMDPSDSTALIDKPVVEAPSLHDSDAIPAESDELEAIANNRAMSQSPAQRSESQLTNRTDVDHGYSRANVFFNTFSHN